MTMTGLDDSMIYTPTQDSNLEIERSIVVPLSQQLHLDIAGSIPLAHAL